MNDRGKTKGQLLAELSAARAAIARLEAVSASRPAQVSPTPGSAFSDGFANSLPGILYLFDVNGQLLWWNQQFERATGYRAEELARAPMERFVPGATMPLETGSGEVEAPLILKDGRRVPYHFTNQRIEFAGAPCLIGMGI